MKTLKNNLVLHLIIAFSSPSIFATKKTSCHLVDAHASGLVCLLAEQTPCLSKQTLVA